MTPGDDRRHPQVRREQHQMEAALLLGFGLSKTKALILSGEIRSVKIGRNRRVLPAWVDEYVNRCAADAEGWAA